RHPGDGSPAGLPALPSGSGRDGRHRARPRAVPGDRDTPSRPHRPRERSGCRDEGHRDPAPRRRARGLLKALAVERGAASRSLHRWPATLSIRMPHARQAFRFADLRDVLLGSVMARRAVRAALVTVLLSAALRGSAAAGPLALDEALARARAASPALRVAAAELEAAHGRLRQARLVQANPVLSADLARHTAPAGDEDAKDRGVQLEQEIEVGGQRGLRIAAAEHDVTHAEHLLADRRRTVEGEVRRAFFALAAAERRQKLAAERLTLASRFAEAARRRSRAGETGALDARLAEVETARAAQEKTAAEAEHARAEGRLATAIGAEPGEPLSASVEDVALAPSPGDEAHGAAVEEARLKAQIPRDVHLALAHRRAAEEAWRRYEREALPAATQARDLLERGYDAGYLSLSEVLVQQDRLLQVRAGAIDAWLDLHQAEADVVEAAGTAP